MKMLNRVYSCGEDDIVTRQIKLPTYGKLTAN